MVYNNLCHSNLSALRCPWFIQDAATIKDYHPVCVFTCLKIHQFRRLSLVRLIYLKAKEEQVLAIIYYILSFPTPQPLGTVFYD